MKLLVPIAQADLDTFKQNLSWYIDYLPINGIIVVAKAELHSSFTEYNNISFIDEDTLLNGLTFAGISEQLLRIIPENGSKRTGWYFQQFLKMAYAYICSDDYYLIWDSDTIPTHKIEMFDLESKKPYFDTKTEYNKSYFETMETLLPYLKKFYDFSFVSEHMIIKASIMKDLITSIESNNEIEGNQFFEKILNAIKQEDILKSGFSEYEMYGTFASFKYSNLYLFRKWTSLRRAEHFFDRSKLTHKEIKWLCSCYDAISFERIEKSFWNQLLIRMRVNTIIPCTLLQLLLSLFSRCKIILYTLFPKPNE